MKNSNIYIHQITTQAAPFCYPQSFIRDKMKDWSQDEKSRRIIHSLYQRSGIEQRYSVVPDFGSGKEGALFEIGTDQMPVSPTTAERNRDYTNAAHDMAVSLARRVIQQSAFNPEDITHIIFTSCTGFSNPGPDFHIIRELGLSHRVQRYTLGFMGCYAAFPALRMATQCCEADTEAVVLVICLELCTLHMQLDGKADNMLANSLFADGAAAAILSSRIPAEDRPAFKVGGFASALVPSGEAHMAWDIGNHGFNIVLSSYVPDILGTELHPMMQKLFKEQNRQLGDIDEWAVHPGGRAILDKVETGLGLPENSLTVSRSVLRDFGNMSSATVLFVLARMLYESTTPEASTCAMAFGPGLTVEAAFLQRIHGQNHPVTNSQETLPDSAEDCLHAMAAMI